MLAALGGGLYWAHDRGRDIVFELLSTIFILWCLATIGLISQVFHTGGRIHQALAFWLVITLPLASAGKRTFLPATWTDGALVSSMSGRLPRDPGGRKTSPWTGITSTMTTSSPCS